MPLILGWPNISLRFFCDSMKDLNRPFGQPNITIWRVCVCIHVQSYSTLCDPMDYSLPSSSVHGIFQARLLEWVATHSFRGSSWPRDWTGISCVSCITGRFFLPLSHGCLSLVQCYFAVVDFTSGTLHGILRKKVCPLKLFYFLRWWLYYWEMMN